MCSTESNGAITLLLLPLPAVSLSEMRTFVELEYLLKCTWEKQANYTWAVAHLLAGWMNVFYNITLFIIIQLRKYFKSKDILFFIWEKYFAE